MDFAVNFLASAVRLAIPVLIAALGLLYSERAGIVNIGAEGIMLIGALAGYAGSVFFHSEWIGALLSIFFGLLVGLGFAFLVVSAKANQTVVGAMLNILGSGITVTLNRVLFASGTALPDVQSFADLPIPFLSSIPVLGNILFSQNALVYLSFAILILSHFVLFQTRLGLTIRAVGEYPKACDTVGINVYRVRYGTILYSTALCSLAGAYMSTAQMSSFIEGMVSGRGFIALAAVVFGRWKPFGVLAAVLVFGAGEALQYKLLAILPDVPYQFFQMIPYFLTLFALILSANSEGANGPQASGVPYVKE